MKVYIVLPDYDYEGYGEPIAAFTSKEAAEKCAADEKAKSRFCGFTEIFELELDYPAD